MLVGVGLAVRVAVIVGRVPNVYISIHGSRPWIATRAERYVVIRAIRLATTKEKHAISGELVMAGAERKLKRDV